MLLLYFLYCLYLLNYLHIMCFFNFAVFDLFFEKCIKICFLYIIMQNNLFNSFCYMNHYYLLFKYMFYLSFLLFLCHVAWCWMLKFSRKFLLKCCHHQDFIMASYWSCIAISLYLEGLLYMMCIWLYLFFLNKFIEYTCVYSLRCACVHLYVYSCE